MADYHRRWQEANRDKKRAQDGRYRERKRLDLDYWERRRAAVASIGRGSELKLVIRSDEAASGRAGLSHAGLGCRASLHDPLAEFIEGSSATSNRVEPLHLEFERVRGVELEAPGALELPSASPIDPPLLGDRVVNCGVN
jgi:hypothetical protein